MSAERLEHSVPLAESMTNTRRPIVELLALAGPTVAQMVSYVVLQFTDTWMLSQLPESGAVAATAAATAGMFSFSFVGFGTGVLAVGSSRVDLQACKLEYSIVSPK